MAATTTGTLDNVPAPGTITIVTDSSGQFTPGQQIAFTETLQVGSTVGALVSFDIDNSGRDPLAVGITLVNPPSTDNDSYRNKRGFQEQ